MKKRAGPRPRRVPQRRCVACQQVRAKRELVRLVQIATGQVAVDPSGKRAGRGAYLCRQRRCWEIALQRRALEHALKASISPESIAQLKEYGEGLADGVSTPLPAVTAVEGQGAKKGWARQP